MSIAQAFIGELTHEAQTTRKLLERIPEQHFDWKPHEKSMTLQRLAVHVTEMHGWISTTVETPALDFAAMDYKPKSPQTTAELVAMFDETLAQAVKSLSQVTDESLMVRWQLRHGEQVLLDLPRAQVLRGMVMNHIIHHRGQLSVYLRWLDIPLPAIYGPSADER
ncbi:MAG: DinB family protein [Chloracidobacterium sp.]|uniref:DinB family protein n=1 Tax=Chloracidobacterium validum TaxID=2821543 RepID=A0ABX8BGL3_9BACT|nr:DinB family protein [Chloracidobacterium validum]QUW04625.1 DinB family protein [Chloracidobacterium validum]